MLLLVRPGQHANRCSARRLSPTSRHGAQRDSGRRLTSRGGVCAIWLRALWQLQRRVALPGGLRVPTLRRGSPRRHRCRLCRFGCAPCSRRWSSKAVRVRWRGRCGYGETERPARNVRRTVFQNPLLLAVYCSSAFPLHGRVHGLAPTDTVHDLVRPVQTGTASMPYSFARPARPNGPCGHRARGRLRC